jgi:hypothetical protein
MERLPKNHEQDNQDPQDSTECESEIGQLRDEWSRAMMMPGQNIS